MRELSAEWGKGVDDFFAKSKPYDPQDFMALKVTKAENYGQRKRREAVAYFKAKEQAAHETEVDTLRRTLYEVLHDIYGPTPKYQRIEA